MRAAFVKALINEAKRRDFHVFSGDLGFQVFEEFIQAFPDRFTNVGVSEANMVGMAAGMARSGITTICYSIVPFVVFRAFEQIRNDLCYHNLNVKIVGVGGGLGYAYNGQSHQSIEDIALMRSLPNMTIVCPGDPLECYKATQQAISKSGPVYLRLGKLGENILAYETIGLFKIGKTSVYRKGKDIVIFSTGNMLETVLNVASQLELLNLSPTVVNVHTVKPVNETEIETFIKTHSYIITLEEHSIYGGLGSLISEINSSHPECRKPQLIIGVPDTYLRVCGTQDYLRSVVGLGSDKVVERIRRWLKRPHDWRK